MVVLNDFVLFLKQESGSRAQGWNVRGFIIFHEGEGIQQSVAREIEDKEYSENHPESRNIYSYLSSFSFVCLYFPVSQGVTS